MPAHYNYPRASGARAREFLEGLSQVSIPYGNIAWERAEQFQEVDVMARLHEAWATHELLDHRLLDDKGMIQEFEYPEGKVTVDL